MTVDGNPADIGIRDMGSVEVQRQALLKTEHQRKARPHFDGINGSVIVKGFRQQGDRLWRRSGGYHPVEAGVVPTIVIGELPSVVACKGIDPGIQLNIQSLRTMLADPVHSRHEHVAWLIIHPVFPLDDLLAIKLDVTRMPALDDACCDQRLNEMLKGRRARSEVLGTVIEAVRLSTPGCHAATEAP